VVADAVDEGSWRAESGGIVIADAVERGELSATTERLVRPRVRDRQLRRRTSPHRAPVRSLSAPVDG